MSLLDQIGKKIVGAGQGVAQQTKNLTDIAKLSNAVGEAEKRVAVLFEEIGRSYYERHKTDSQTAEQAKITEIKQMFSLIDQCQEKMKEIKGVIKCPSCGADTPYTSAFCNSCGAKQTLSKPGMPQLSKAEMAQETERCPKCGATTNPDDAFCFACGAAKGK